MGDGDPYIAGFIGFILGTPAVFAFLFLSFIIGGIGCFILIVSRKKQFKQYVAFGPYLALGGLLTFL
jgi:leader peptidase (prepilin peptidase)/N-methyltransferase